MREDIETKKGGVMERKKWEDASGTCHNDKPGLYDGDDG